MNGTCTCGKFSRIRRGMCEACYTRWYRNRTDEERRRPTLQERWEAKFKRRGPDDCWLWTGSKVNGYGEFYVSAERGKVKAHSFAVELATGVRCPPSQGGLHRCDNPPCVNPAHIYYGTQKQNSADMVARRRHQVGEERPNSRLTEQQIVEIRERFAAGETFTVLRADYDVTSGWLSCVVNGKYWKHVGGPINVHNKPGARPKNARSCEAGAA